MKSNHSFFPYLLVLLITFPSLALAKTGSSDISVGFSPGHTALPIILEVIKGAQKTLDIEAYSFTSKEISAALVDAYSRGIKIRVVADKKANSSRYTALTFLANHKIPVRLNSKYAIMHNKVMIADKDSVQTGSFNYTASADKHNAENVIVIRNNKSIAAIYFNEFERLWQESSDLPPAY